MNYDIDRELMRETTTNKYTTNKTQKRTHLRASPPEQRDERGEQEAGRLSRPGLRTRHQVAVGDTDGDGVLLHRGRFRVPAQVCGPHEVLAKHVQLEGLDGFGDVLSRGLHGDVVILLLRSS